MSKPPKDVTVDVTLESSSPIKFSTTSKSLPKGPNEELIFDNNGYDGFKIDFVFIDGTGEGYTFPPNSRKDEAVWSQLGAKCPSAQGNPLVFQPLHVNVARNVLTVRNTNQAPILGPFSYTLRVTTDDGANYLPLDPGGLNQNGPTTRDLSFRTLAIGVGIVALIAYGLYRLGVFNR